MRSSIRRRLAAAAVAITALAPAAAAHAAAPPADWRPYAPDTPFNQRLRADAPLHARSADWVGYLGEQLAAKGAYINTSTCGMPMFWADADTPRQRVVLAATAYQDRALISAWSSVPIPADAKAANCGDKNFAVLQRQPDGTVDMWEFWSATKAADGTWTARFGGATENVQAERGIASALQWTDPAATDPLARASGFGWNVTATSISMVAGVITDEDIDRGVIDHALALAPTEALKGSWLWPAQRTDGGSTDPDAIPEGARLRLDPSLDLSTLQLAPLVRMMAEAAQRYGIIIRDRTKAANAFYGEPPAPGQPDKVRQALAGQWPDAALRAFPWDRLQVLDAPSCSTWAECKVAPAAVISVDTAQPQADQPLVLDTANSRLNHARSAVQWDLDGDGTFETDAGTALGISFTPRGGGPRRIGVRITTRDGVATEGFADVDVEAPAGEVEITPPTPVTLAPDDLAASYFYSYSTRFSKLEAVRGATVPPARPDATRKLYSTTTSGTATVHFADPLGAVAAGGVVQAHVSCSVTRCARLKVLDGAGAVIGQAAPAFGATGWVTVPLAGALTADQAAGLRLQASVAGAGSASGSASIAAVRAVLPVMIGS